MGKGKQDGGGGRIEIEGKAMCVCGRNADGTELLYGYAHLTRKQKEIKEMMKVIKKIRSNKKSLLVKIRA